MLRLFKMGKHSRGMQMLARVMINSLPALSILLFFSVVLIVLFGALMFFCEGASYSVADEFLAGGYPQGVYTRATVDGYADEVTPFRSIPFCFWWACTTMSFCHHGRPCVASGLVAHHR